MQLTSTILALAAAASAADLRNYFETNCGGGYSVCTNVNSGVCCVQAGGVGAPSVAVVYTSPATQLFGYQTTRDGNQCGAIAKQQATGAYSFLCMSLDANIGQFSASRWYPGAALKRGAETCSPTSTEQCTGAVTPDRVVLTDGHLFVIDRADDATKTAMFAFAANGSTTADLPEKFAALEHDKEGVAQRLQSINARSL